MAGGRDSHGDTVLGDLRSGLESPFLESVDLLRLDATRQLSPDRKVSLGQFLTPPAVARLMASMFGGVVDSVRVLDAGAGSGSLVAAFVEEVCQRPRRPTAVSVTAFELDAALATFLGSTISACEKQASKGGIGFSSQIRHEDFIRSGVEAVRGGLFGTGERLEFDCIILNPPYRKLATASEERRLLQSVGIEATNLYAAFVALAVRLLRPGGELVAITPRSFCNGPYFRQFRQEFLRTMSLRRVHVFGSRSRAFRDAEVLQENIIFHAAKGTNCPQSVTISSSEGPEDEAVVTKEVPYGRVVCPEDKDAFIRLVTDDLEEEVAEWMASLGATLPDLGLTVSTGRVVDFRSKEYLRAIPGQGAAPLIYPCHLRGGAVQWPCETGRKPNALRIVAGTEPLLVDADVYVLVKRFTTKEERRRVVASVFEPKAVVGDRVAFENHLNYFHCRGRGLSVPLARGLAAFLNSTLVDLYFRQFNGHTQVNATDLRSLRYPCLQQLERLGARVGTKVSEEAVVDEAIQSELFDGEGVAEGGDPVRGRKKVQDGLSVLRALGLPQEQLNERSALTLLALLDIKPGTGWKEANSPLRGITEMMNFFAKHYGKRYAPNTRETVRRFTVHQFVQAGLLLENPDEPTRPTNSPKAVYQVEASALNLLRSFGSPQWEKNLRGYLATVETLRQRYAQDREMRRIPLELPTGAKLTLSPGGQNELVSKIVKDFCPCFTPGAKPLYIGDTQKKWAHFDKEGLRALGVEVDEHGKMPDVVVYDSRKKWLVLVEAVTSHGPVSPKRRMELKSLFKGARVGIVYVTAFMDRRAMVKYVSEIAWETEVWIADAPTHLIHFNGERFLGPYA